MSKSTQPKSILAWHFLAGDKLRDGRVAPANGEALLHPAAEPLKLCASGLHASCNILHALVYAPGTTLCRVRCSGEIQLSDDKLVCRKRVIMWRLDPQVMRRVLIWWAYWCAERAQVYADAAAAHYAAAAAAAAAA